MGIYAEWLKLAQSARPQHEQQAFWDQYFAQETGVYEKILERVDRPFSGTFVELAKELGLEEVVLAGFIDGINTSLKAGEYDLDTLETDTPISLEVDLEKLYYNMLDAKADWLYNLPQWGPLLTIESRQEITKQFRKDKIFVADKKTPRNAPCPCGSGKKYKNCHGKAGAEEQSLSE